MVLVITDNLALSMVYATSLGGIMVGKQSIRRKNLDEHKALLMEKARTDGFLTTFFRGEQYVFVCIPFEAYALNRMVDYQADYRTLGNRPIPFIPDSFEYRCCDEQMEKQRNRLEGFCSSASSIVNATTDSMMGTLAFLHFQKMFPFNKTVTRARPTTLSEEKILEAFNAREDAVVFRDFADACLLFERLNWLVNCNVSNAVMQATGGRVQMAAGRIEAILLNIIQRETSKVSGSGRVVLKDAKSGGEVICRVAAPPLGKPDFTKLRKGMRCQPGEPIKEERPSKRIGNCFSVLVRSGAEYGMSLQAASEALWRLFVEGYITWPSSSQATPWSLKTALTAAVSQLAKQPRFKERISPADIERYVGWDAEGVSDGRTATIVTAKTPTGLSEAEQAVYDIIGESIIREFAPQGEYVVPSFDGGGQKLIAQDAVPASVVASGKWSIKQVSLPGETPYLDYDLLRDVLPFFDAALCEDYRYFLPPLDNILAWGMANKTDDGGLHITKRGELLLKYVSSTPLVDPAETAFWDCRFQKVAAGIASAQGVMAEVTPYIKDLVNYVKVAVDVIQATGGIAPSDCVCPMCGAMLEWDNERKGWDCSSTNQICQFFLPGVFRGHTLSVRDMALLLTKGESEMAFDFSSAKGTFPARLVLNANHQLELSFQSHCLCPKCKQKYMNEFQWGLACPDKECGFTANTQRCGVRLTEADEKDIFSGKRTRWISGFVSAKNRPFTARLYLSDDMKIAFEFQTKSN